LKETREELKGVVEVKIKRESYKKKDEEELSNCFPSRSSSSSTSGNIN
jgi:hypothetical protein